MYHVLLCSYDTEQQAQHAQELLEVQGIRTDIVGEYYLQIYQGKNKADAEMHAALLRSKGVECIVKYYRGDVE